MGEHSVGSPVGETPPWPEPLHWLTVTGVVVVATGMLLVTLTLQVTLLPPARMPLHWLTLVTSWSDVVVLVVQPKGGRTPAAARHEVVVTVELVAPWGVMVFTIVVLQLTSNPAPVGKSGGLH